MTFDLKAHDEHFGVTEDRKKPGGSNVGKYKEGPFCGPSGGAPKGTYPVNTRARAISAIAYAKNAPNPAGIKACVCRHYPDLPACKSKEKQAMTFEKRTMPKAALHFMDPECFAKVNRGEDQDELMMVAYSGGVIPKHWFWGDLAIDLNGMSFPKERYPILENHDTGKKIGFADSLDVDSGALVVKKATFVDTPESLEFRRLSKEGFPFESSIFASPSVIEKIPDGKEAEVNGMAVTGPATIWRESTFKEASVCVFGYDPNTKSAAFASDEIEVAMNEIINAPESDPINNLEKEVKSMDFEQFSKEHPELLKEIVDNITADLTEKFNREKQDLEGKFTQERNGFSEERKQFQEKLAQLEKAEAIRREKELRLEARTVWQDKLSNSEIPDRLHDKVMTQVSYEKFVKDGVLDMEGFRSAIDDEIKDWSDRGITSNVLGFGVSVKGVEDSAARKQKQEADDDEAAVKELLSMVGDPAANA